MNHPQDVFPQIICQLLKLYLETIPHNNGNSHTPNLFTDSRENLFITVSVANDRTLNSHLLRAVLGK